MNELEKVSKQFNGAGKGAVSYSCFDQSTGGFSSENPPADLHQALYQRKLEYQMQE